MKKIKSWQKRPVLLYIITVLVLLFLLLPILIVVPMSFTSGTLLRFPPEGFSLRWYEKFFQDRQWIGSAIVSIKAAFGTMIVSVLLGTLASVGIAKKIMVKSKWVKIVLQIPMIIPAVIVAVSMYLVFGRYKVLGKMWVIILAHSCLAIPFVVTLMTSALQGLDASQYDAARVLGANHFQATVKVVLPLIKTAIFSSCLFAFIISFDESVLVLFITKTKTLTLPRMMYADLKYGISPALASVSTLLICTTLTFFLLSKLIASMSPDAKAKRMQAKLEKELFKLEIKRRKQELAKAEQAQS